MLGIIAIVLIALWFVGFVFHIGGNTTPLLLAASVVLFILHVL